MFQVYDEHLPAAIRVASASIEVVDGVVAFSVVGTDVVVATQ